MIIRYVPYRIFPGPSRGVERQYPFISGVRQQLWWRFEVLAGSIWPSPDRDPAGASAVKW